MKQEIPESILDDKVRRILRVQHRIGMYDKARYKGERNSIKHQTAARKIATEGVVLLKNEPVNQQAVLPLNQKAIKHILVLGPNADKKHGQGGGSSEVKSLYEITPLAGLKAQLGNEVKITLMRAKSSELAPIASDYVASRHWTGTPAWNIAYYSDQNRNQLIDESWVVDSQYQPVNVSSPVFITMSADIKPLNTGIHELIVKTEGALV